MTSEMIVIGLAFVLCVPLAFRARRVKTELLNMCSIVERFAAEIEVRKGQSSPELRQISHYMSSLMLVSPLMLTKVVPGPTEKVKHDQRLLEFLKANQWICPYVTSINGCYAILLVTHRPLHLAAYRDALFCVIARRLFSHDRGLIVVSFNPERVTQVVEQAPSIEFTEGVLACA